MVVTQDKACPFVLLPCWFWMFSPLQLHIPLNDWLSELKLYYSKLPVRAIVINTRIGKVE